MTFTVVTCLGVTIVFCFVLYLFGRSKKEEGLSEADKVIAMNAAKLKEKQLEIANEPDADRDAVLDRMRERLF